MGATVSKANAYAVATQPAGAAVAKAILYAIATQPAGVAVSKAVAYAVVAPPSGATVSKAVAYAVVVDDSFRIDELSPTSGHTGGGYEVTVLGAGFDSLATATVDGAPASVIFDTPYRLRVRMPAHAAGAVSIVVTNPSTNETRSASFTYTAASAGTCTPSSARVGDVVTVTGTGLYAGAVVRIGGVFAATTYVSTTELRAVVPQLSPGSYTVEILNAAPGYSETLTLAAPLVVLEPLVAIANRPIVMYVIS